MQVKIKTYKKTLKYINSTIAHIQIIKLPHKDDLMNHSQTVFHCHISNNQHVKCLGINKKFSVKTYKLKYGLIFLITPQLNNLYIYLTQRAPKALVKDKKQNKCI